MLHKVFKKGYSKLFISYVLLVVLPLIAGFYIIYAIFVYNEENKYEDKLSDNVKRFASGVDAVLASVESISLQVSMLPSVNNILNRQEDSVMADYYQLKQDMQYYSYYNTIFHSFYIYFKASDRVLTTTETFFYRDSFYDREILDEALGKSKYEKWYSARYIHGNRYWPEGGMLITFARTLPVSGKSPVGALIVNIKEDTFLTTLSNLLGKNFDFLVVDGNGRVISSSQREHRQKSLQELKLRSLSKNDGLPYKTELQGGLRFVVSEKSEITGWTYILLAPYEDFRFTLDGQRTVLFVIFTGILIIMFFVGLLFSSTMHSKWKKLLVKLGLYIQKVGLKAEEEDAYDLVSSAIEKLVDDTVHIEAMVQKYKPVVRERLLSDLLLGNIFSEEERISRQAYAELIFEKKYFIAGAVAILGLEEYDDAKTKGDIRIYVKEAIEYRFDMEIKAYCVMMEEDRLGVILNSDHFIDAPDAAASDRVRDICRNINTDIRARAGINIFISFGPVCSGESGIADSYEVARKNLEYKSLSDDETVLFAREGDIATSYPTLLQKQLVNGIRNLKSDTIVKAVDALFEEYVHGSRYSLENLKGIISVMISTVLGELWQEGMDIETVRGLEFISGISQCANAALLKKYLINGLTELMVGEERTDAASENSAVHISRVIKFIRENYRKDIAVADIAAYAGLNPRYLAKIFKNATGKTVLEYLTRLRMHKARELIGDERLSLKDISRDIGYNDVHSFIRFFKKYEGITPGEFRQNIPGKEESSSNS